MVSRMGIDMNPEVEAVMRSTIVQKHIQDGIESKDIKLVDKRRQTMFRDEMHKIGKKGENADADSSPERNGQQFDHKQL